RYTTVSRSQLGVQCDRGIEYLGNRAVLLGLASHSRKRSLVQFRHLGAQGQSGPADAKPLAFRLESDRSLGIELGRSIAGALQLKGQCHREASSVRRSDQFFGVCALLILEPRLERIRGVGEHPGIGGEMAAAGATRATPNGFRLADHGTSPRYLRFGLSRIH